MFSTAFQPLFSVSHGRSVGHEALLRVTGSDGVNIPPNVYLASLGGVSELAQADLTALQTHLRAYEQTGRASAPEWLFLNVHPASTLGPDGELQAIRSAITYSAVKPEQLVIEVLESPLAGEATLRESVEAFRDLGCLIALDDFGSGHSNFERVFDLQPHIVKLDRNVVLRAKQGPRERRIVQRMVSLLHECGALVVMEGIETLAGAHIAMTCDVDFVQGYFFARPHAELRARRATCAPLDEAWQSFDVRLSRVEDRWRESMTVQSDKLRIASIALASGAPLEEACRDFLSLPNSSMCFLLDDAGRQIGSTVFGAGASTQICGDHAQFAPLHDCDGARWSRRQYFRRALSYIGAVQLTRPYLTLQGGQMCFTASIAFEMGDAVVILCGDLSAPDKAETV